MRRIWLAIRVFFAVLFNGERAGRAELLLLPGADAVPPAPREDAAVPTSKQLTVSDFTPPSPPGKPATPKPARSEALTLLAALQREARLVDFLQEPLDEYSDDQVGAAVRDVHRQCRQALERMFALQPILGDAEGATIDVPAGFDAGKYRLTGNVAGQAPFRGQLAHHGWQAGKCDLPSWSGGKEAAMVVAPAEVEVKA
jgi:hypothetical protein